MTRRDFITLLGGAAAAWPLAVRAQQPQGLRRIGVLMGGAENNPQQLAGLAVFKRTLQDLGWTDGRNVRIDYRWGAADVGRMQAFAKELVGLKPDLLVGNTTPATAALLRETKAISIVFMVVSDPVGSGFVARLPRPGGNITGFVNIEGSVAGKWIEIFKDIVPGASRASLLYNPGTARPISIITCNPSRPRRDRVGSSRLLPPSEQRRILSKPSRASAIGAARVS